MVSKPIHLFLKLKSFFSVTAGATCSNKDFAASGRDLHFAWVAWLCPLLKCRPRRDTMPAFLPSLLAVFPSLSATRFAQLNRWTLYCPVTAINTTVALFWPDPCLAAFTFIKILASVCWHCFFLSVSTNRAGNY